MRAWMALFESNQQVIDIVEEYGSAEGYVVDASSGIVANWFMHRHDVYEPTIIDSIQTDYERVAFLNNINVSEDARGNRYGAELLQRFESEAMSQGAQAIILFADINETQVSGFDLTQWYKRVGYEEIHPPEGLLYCPLMIKELF